MGNRWVFAVCAVGLLQTGGAWAQASGGGTVTISPPEIAEPEIAEPEIAAPETGPASSKRPKARPEGAATPVEAAPAVVIDVPAAPTTAKPATPPRDPSKGAVTNLPIPRFVSLKGNEGNARRGPSLTHRIDWVFTTSGTPLRVTAEHENWRRVEDAEGMGGWVHYALLSGVRSVLVSADMAEFRLKPSRSAGVAFQAEQGVIGRLMACDPDWCRVNIQGEKGWIEKTALWGVLPGEIVE